MNDIVNCKRILILGCSGCGKSTLTRHLSELLNLESIHLDQYFWNAGWVQTDPEAWALKTKELANRDSWIMDGNFNRSLEVRLPRADFIILMAYPRLRCLWRVIRRWRTYPGESRPDMAEGCHEKADFEFYRWIWNFYHDEWPRTLDLIKMHASKTPSINLNSDRQIQMFTDNVIVSIDGSATI